MLRNSTLSPTPVQSRRRYRQQARDSCSQPPRIFRNEVPGSTSKHEKLELSMQLVRNPSSNRFEALASPPTPPPPRELKSSKSPRDYHVPNRYHRSSNSRGTKEAKRRRDARRSQRKLASAQMLDERLSREIDATLTRLNVLPQPSTARPTPRLISPVTTMSTPPMAPHLPSTPPQLPMLEFPSFSLNAFSEFECTLTMPRSVSTSMKRREIAPAHRALTPPATPPMTPWPSWCSPLPCLIRDSMRQRDVPIFYDLSHLPEPKEKPGRRTPPPKCQELQLWRPTPVLTPKVSRFFPPSPPSAPVKPKVKLPALQTACKLHKVETGLRAPVADALPKCLGNVLSGGATESLKHSNFAELVRSDSVAGLAGDHIEASLAPTRSLVTTTLEPSAANLWHILMSQDNTHNYAHEDPFVWNVTSDSPKTDSYLPSWLYHEAIQEPESTVFELEGKEIPYAHGNSLTGHANEMGLPPYIHASSMVDSAVCLAPSPPVGLSEELIQHYVGDTVGMNEMMMDYDIGEPYHTPIVTCIISKPARPISPLCELRDILPVDCIANEADKMQESDAHFQSEAELFSLPPLSASLEQSIIDIAAFLKMGHAKHCWCSDCYEEDGKEEQVPELVPSEEDSEAEWMLCSSTIPEATLTASESGECASQAMAVKCTTVEEQWEDFLTERSSSAWDFGEEVGDGERWELEWELEF